MWGRDGALLYFRSRATGRRYRPVEDITIAADRIREEVTVPSSSIPGGIATARQRGSVAFPFRTSSSVHGRIVGHSGGLTIGVARVRVLESPLRCEQGWKNTMARIDKQVAAEVSWYGRVTGQHGPKQGETGSSPAPRTRSIQMGRCPRPNDKNGPSTPRQFAYRVLARVGPLLERTRTALTHRDLKSGGRRFDPAPGHLSHWHQWGQPCLNDLRCSRTDLVGAPLGGVNIIDNVTPAAASQKHRSRDSLGPSHSPTR